MKNRWTRKTINLPGCHPFPALVDMHKADKFGRYYGVADSLGAPFQPECIGEPKPEFEQSYEKLEKQFASDRQTVVSVQKRRKFNV